MSGCFNGLTFVFDNKSSDLFGLYMGWRDASDEWETGLNREPVNSETNTVRHIVNNYGVKYTDPLVLPFDIYHQDGSAFTYRESRAINNWLVQDEYKKLKINDNNTDNVYYRVICTSIQDITLGTFNGKHIEMQCDSSFAYSQDSIKIIDATHSGTAKYNVDNTSDAGIYYPHFSIVCAADYDGTVEFNNTTDGKTMVLDMSGISGEDKKILNVDAEHMQMTDADGNLVPLYKVGWKILPDDNKAIQSNELYWLRLLPGINVIEIKGNAKIKFVVSFPRKAGQVGE